MKHASAKNVIERCFGLLKIRWAILRSLSYYPIQMQCCIISTCCLVHNFIRRKMSFDPMKSEINLNLVNGCVTEQDIVGLVASSDQWTSFRDDLTMQMYNEWRGS